MLDLAMHPQSPKDCDVSDLWLQIHVYIKNKTKITGVEQISTYFNYIQHVAFMARSSYSLCEETFLGGKVG